MGIQADIARLVAESGATSVAVGFCDLDTGNEWFILPDEPFHAASTMKVCVMMELFRQANAGQLSLDESIEIRNEFSSIVDGAPFSVDGEEDSEHSFHARLGESETLINLAIPMVTHSSNLATNLLVDRLGPDKITEFMNDLGAPGLSVLRGVDDSRAYRLGMNNTVTARGLTAIMTRLGKREVVSQAASDAMIDILLAQAHRNSIPAKLPSEVKVANKTGWNTGICHDVAIVYPPGRSAFALTILTRGLDTKTAGQELIAAISAEVFHAHATD